MEQWFLLSSVSDAVVPSRARLGRPFAAVEREMDAIVAAHHIADGDAFSLPDAPEAYQRLNRAWEQSAYLEVSRWLASLGEKEMARLMISDRAAFDEYRMEGRDEIAESIE